MRCHAHNVGQRGGGRHGDRDHDCDRAPVRSVALEGWGIFLLPVPALLAAALLAPVPVHAQVDARAITDPVAEPVLAPVLTRHRVVIRGAEVAYRAIAAEHVLADSTGAPLATMFSTSYVREGVEDAARRPVLFAFNGGPGASSTPLHFQSLGPVLRAGTVEGGDRRMVPNPESVLDAADLVFVDPVGTGFSRALVEGGGRAFWSPPGDARAMRDFIVAWMAEHGRTGAPAYVCGESYGGFRLALMMADPGALQPDGVILVSPMLDASGSSEATGNDLPHVFALPTMAAAAWHHGRVARRGLDVAAFWEEAASFAAGEYAVALMRGSRISPEERNRIAERAGAFVGLPAAFVEAADLRIGTESFVRTLMRDRGLRIGRLDTRATGDAAELERRPPPLDDPSMSLSTGPNTVVSKYFRETLGVRTERAYVPLNLQVNSRWDWFARPRPPFYWNATPGLAAALRDRPTMRVMLVGGLYDLATPVLAARYAIEHAGVPVERVTTLALPGGHSFYEDEDNRTSFNDAVRAFVAGETPPPR
jgi:carboxypeptidase C (cathepsin A)